jgi:hypothetical protein
MRRSTPFFLFLAAFATGALAAPVARAVPNEQRHAIALTNVAVGRHEPLLSPGVAYTLEPIPWLRFGIDVGAFGVGTGSWDRQQLTAAVRVLDSGETMAHFRYRVFASTGLARFATRDKEDDGPGPFSRVTLGPSATIDLDATYFGGSGTGFTARVGAGCLLVLDQSIYQAASTYKPSQNRQGYSTAPLVSIALGYSF